MPTKPEGVYQDGRAAGISRLNVGQDQRKTARRETYSNRQKSLRMSTQLAPPWPEAGSGDGCNSGAQLGDHTQVTDLWRSSRFHVRPSRPDWPLLSERAIGLLLDFE